MNYSNSEISLYVDTMIVETLLTDSHLSKFANEGIVSGIISKVKDYFGAHFDPSDKTGSIINMLAPGAISLALGAMGFTWIGPLLGLAMSVFHINVKGILTDIWNSVKGVVSSGKQTSSENINGIVDSAVSSHATPATEEEANQAERQLTKENSLKLLRDARLIKIAMVEFEKSPESFTKEAGIFTWFATKKGATSSLLAIVLKWFFKIVLASAGLMVAGDVVNKFLERPNALDGTLQHGQPTESVAVPKVISKQTRFPVNVGYQDVSHNTSDGWIENVQNNKSSITNMLLGWAKQVYKGLDGLDSVIESTAGFQALVDAISWQNHASEGGPIVFIPRMFTSKKMIVDHFIDEVAEKAPKYGIGMHNIINYNMVNKYEKI